VATVSAPGAPHHWWTGQQPETRALKNGQRPSMRSSGGHHAGQNPMGVWTYRFATTAGSSDSAQVPLP